MGCLGGGGKNTMWWMRHPESRHRACVRLLSSTYKQEANENISKTACARPGNRPNYSVFKKNHGFAWWRARRLKIFLEMGSEEAIQFRPSIVVKAEPLENPPAFDYTSLSQAESRVVFRNYYEVHTDGNIMERTSSVESLLSHSSGENDTSSRSPDNEESVVNPSPLEQVKSEYFSFPAYRADWKNKRVWSRRGFWRGRT